IMGYSQYKIKNKEACLSKNPSFKPEMVDLVFTKYPSNKDNWRTPYDTLLKKRIEEVLSVFPDLNKSTVKWNFILQTSCTNEAEARKMFHGAVIKYSEIKDLKRTGITQKTGTVINKSVPLAARPEDFKHIISQDAAFEDSVVFQVFERNKNWKNMTVVNDWTGSMYFYGAQVALWHKLNFDKGSVAHLLFFNDGDQQKDYQKKIGTTGGIYTCQPDSFSEIISTMEKAMKNGNGGDLQENVVEALIKASSLDNSNGDLILIADNNAPIRDLSLLSEIKRPVRIIVCHGNRNLEINPHLLMLAVATNGSIHTMEEDLYNLQQLKEGQKVKLQNVPYIMLNGKLMRYKKYMTVANNQF
ncbi:MAG TPA: hypothetical protein VIK89_11120, partial [Cytophagaceae bacterium]